jgi:hypothetical protein
VTVPQITLVDGVVRLRSLRFQQLFPQIRRFWTVVQGSSPCCAMRFSDGIRPGQAVVSIVTMSRHEHRQRLRILRRPQRQAQIQKNYFDAAKPPVQAQSVRRPRWAAPLRVTSLFVFRRFMEGLRTSKGRTFLARRSGSRHRGAEKLFGALTRPSAIPVDKAAIPRQRDPVSGSFSKVRQERWLRRSLRPNYPGLL